MKKSERVVLALVAVVVVFVAVVSMITSLRGRALVDREPFTLEELEQLARKLELMTCNEPLQPVQTEDAADSGSDERAEVPVPTRLERTPSRKELAERWLERRDGQRRKTAVVAAMMKMIESMLWTVGAESEAGGWAWEAGSKLITLGDWEGARHYFCEALDAPLSPYTYRYVCHYLAWLETDAERAALLLELSCQGDYPPWLWNAIRLCKATGSDTLAQHYVDRLLNVSPEDARFFDEESERKD